VILNDTIAAIATAAGPAGVAVIRISGAEAAVVLARCFRRPGGRAVRPRRLHYGRVVDPTTDEAIDEALACYLPPPHTYTREPVAELHCHGGAVAPRRVLSAALAAGARAAEPGEMTLRAFVNGRLDLAQAEAVLDVVQARTEAQMRLAQLGLGGALSASVGALRKRALDVLAQLTATIDFPEDEPSEADVAEPLRTLVEEIDRLLATADQGALLRAGARVAIVGPPNAGKSTLLNALLGRDRAIVAPTPGTTRDTLEDAVNLDGLPVVLVDTAGLRDSADPLERVGVDRARMAAEAADARLLVVDRSAPLDARAIAALPRRPDLVALNKADLPRRLSGAELALGVEVPIVEVSALTGEGLVELRRALVERVGWRAETAEGALVVANARHVGLLREARGHLEAALRAYYVDGPADAQAAAVAAAVDALGRITGENVTDELLAAVFSRFCIGK